MNKQVIDKDVAREKLLGGINILGDTIGSTLGPSGRTVIYQRGDDPDGPVAITKDGVTAAMNTSSTDPVENLAIKMVREAAMKTAIFAGDGTTTSTVLTQELLNKAFDRDIKSPREFVKGMEAAEKALLECIDKEKIELTDELLLNVATISANNNTELGSIVSEAYKKAGEYGHVGYEINMVGTEMELVVKNGAVVNAGCMDPNFFTDTAAQRVEQKDPLIFVSTGKIDSPRQIESILEYMQKEERPLTVIADAEVGVYQMLAMNASKNGFKLNAVRPSGVGLFLREELGDIAASVGAVLHGDHLGDAANTITPEMLGTCKKLTTTLRDTVLEFDERGPEAKVLAKQVEVQLTKERSEGRRETLKKRLATLQGVFAIVKVGATSGIEVNEKLDLVEDAVKAVASAKQEGIVPGGGNALRYAALVATAPEKRSDEFIEGFKATVYAASQPFSRILRNADLAQPQGSLNASSGIDATTGNVVDLIDSGIVDPTYVVKQALSNAVSIAKTIVTSEATIINLPK